MTETYCDFCHATITARGWWRYPCATFDLDLVGVRADGSVVVDDVVHRMVADWLACAVCHALIEDPRGRPLLARRAVGDYADPVLFDMALALHDRFREHRLGPPVEHATEER
jgi:hypothetical protein